MDFIGRPELAQFIENNLNVEFMAITVSFKEPFGIILKDYIFKLPDLAAIFKEELYEELKGKTKEQLYTIEIHLKDKYLSHIDFYLNWFNENEQLTNKYFPDHNPYELVFNELSFIKRDILLYFPDCKSNQESEIKEAKTDKNLHPPYDPSLWNKDCYELFKYLFENYYKATNVQLVNIWFYLSEYNPEKYLLVATQKEYKKFILKNYKKKITKFTRAQYKYGDKEKSILSEFRILFESNRNKLGNT